MVDERTDASVTAGESVRNFRLLPRRKLPKLPPKGEPFAGLLQPATLIALGIAVVLVVAVVIGITVTRSSAPTTLEGVSAEVTSQVDQLVATLPGEPVDDATDSVVEECVDGSDSQQFALKRVVTPAAGFAPAEWAAAVREEYEAKDWRVVTEGFGDRGGVSIRLIGLSLVPMTADVDPGDDGTRITITSQSRCTG